MQETIFILLNSIISNKYTNQNKERNNVIFLLIEDEELIEEGRLEFCRDDYRSSFASS
jgi:hypothetical protein